MREAREDFSHQAMRGSRGTERKCSALGLCTHVHMCSSDKEIAQVGRKEDRTTDGEHVTDSVCRKMMNQKRAFSPQQEKNE